MVELGANNASATKINLKNASANGNKKCNIVRVTKSLHVYNVIIKDTKKYMIREYSEKIKDMKRKIGKDVHM